MALALALAIVLLAFAVVPAFAIVDDITPADECRGSGGVGGAAAGALKGTGQITDPFFPVPNNNPGSADVTGNPNGVPASCVPSE